MVDYNPALQKGCNRMVLSGLIFVAYSVAFGVLIPTALAWDSLGIPLNSLL
jgi:hypothetical protein